MYSLHRQQESVNMASALGLPCLTHSDRNAVTGGQCRDIGGQFYRQEACSCALKGMGLRMHSLKRERWVEKSAHPSGSILSFQEKFLTSFHAPNEMLAVKLHDPYRNIQGAKRDQFPAYDLSLHRHRREFPETKHLDLCESGGVGLEGLGFRQLTLTLSFSEQARCSAGANIAAFW